MLLNFKFLIKWLINPWRYFVFAIHNRNCSPTSVQSQMAQGIKLPGDIIQFLLHIVYFCTGVILSFSFQRSEYVRYAGWVPALHCGTFQHQSLTQENAQRGNQSNSRSSVHTYVKSLIHEYFGSIWINSKGTRTFLSSYVIEREILNIWGGGNFWVLLPWY